jgi:hydroxymethylpyrimidine/phosphomethylpyrimidine kinase
LILLTRDYLSMPYFALTIAGFDPSGGAGIQIDLKTFLKNGVYGLSAISLLAIQNTSGVEQVTAIEPENLQQQLACLARDFLPNAVKCGALANKKSAEIVFDFILKNKLPLVLDPVFKSSNNVEFLDAEGIDFLLKHVLPITTVFTPNILEAETILKIKIGTLTEMKDAALAISSQFNCNAVLLKGGHLKNNSTDILAFNKAANEITSPLLEMQKIHGTGCLLSSAIAANLAKGLDLITAINLGKEFLSSQMLNSILPGKGARVFNL